MPTHSLLREEIVHDDIPRAGPLAEIHHQKYRLGSEDYCGCSSRNFFRCFAAASAVLW